MIVVLVDCLFFLKCDFPITAINYDIPSVARALVIARKAFTGRLLLLFLNSEIVQTVNTPVRGVDIKIEGLVLIVSYPDPCIIAVYFNVFGTLYNFIYLNISIVQVNVQGLVNLPNLSV